MPLAYGNEANGRGELIAGNGQDSACRFDGVEAERLADMGFDGTNDSFRYGPAIGTWEARWVDTAEDHVGVGHGRPLTATPIADGPGVGTRALGADAQDSCVVNSGDGAAARADGVDVDHRYAHGHAVGDVFFRRYGRHATLDQADIEACASHVAGNQIGKAGLPANLRGGNGACCGTGHDRLHRLLDRQGSGHSTAVALRHQQLAWKACHLQPIRQALQVAPHHRLDKGVHRRGAAALELPHLAQDLAAHGDIAVGPQMADDGCCLLLVRGVGIGVQEVNDDGLRTEFLQSQHGGAHLVFVERHQHPALGVHALGDLEPQLAVDQSLERSCHAVRIGARAASQLQHVTEAACCNQPAARALALQHGIRGDGRPVDEGRYVLQRQSPRREAVKHAF